MRTEGKKEKKVKKKRSKKKKKRRRKEKRERRRASFAIDIFGYATVDNRLNLSTTSTVTYSSAIYSLWYRLQQQKRFVRKLDV